MTATTGHWIPIEPKLRRGRRAWRALVALVERLSTPGCTGDELDAARAEALTKADTCGGDSRAFRVVVSVLCDLRGKGWRFEVKGGKPAVAPPVDGGGSVLEQKERVRSSLLLERDGQLRTPAVRAFVIGMEQRRLTREGWKSIFSVMRDGRDLAEKLRAVRHAPDGPDRLARLKAVVDPYLQFVDSEAICEQTGLRLADIWRYFRHTWVTSYTNAPGRKFWILVRDRAAPQHPVIGIAAFGNAVVQLGPRDEWIGWRAKEFLNLLKTQPSREWAMWLQKSVEEMAGEIFIDDLLTEKVVTRRELDNPTEKTFDRLEAFAAKERKQHSATPQIDVHKYEEDTATNEDWMTRTESHLFRAKRAELLARLLKVRLALKKSEFTEPTREALERFMADAGGRRAVEILLRHAKATHVGINLLEITICGAVAPYNALLGGKLVAMLLTSPEVVKEYERKYRKAYSVIASSMAGRAIQRRPNLVALCTTSLYAAGSAMYNRVAIPAEEVGGSSGDVVRYEKLGLSEGWGSIQFSPATINEIEAILLSSVNGRPINHIFGEGVSPRLRKVRAGMEAVGLPPDKLMQHGTPRIVYGVSLTEQFREVLLGRRTNRPRYYLPGDGPEVTGWISDYWIKRWLSRRIENDDVLEQVASHTLVYPVTHGARVVLPHVPSDEPTLFDFLEEP